MPAKSLTLPGNISNTPDDWQPDGAFRGVFSGYWLSDFYNQGDYGSFWSSSVYNSDRARLLLFYSSYAPDYYDTRIGGYGVRCVVGS
jgi:hypothetical protein